MAVINKLNQDQEDGAAETQQAPGSIPVVGAGQSGAIPSTGQAAAPTMAAGAPKVGSGRFTNLQSYIGANKGSGEKIAGKIGENVQKAADDTNKAVGAAGAVQSQLDAEKARLAQASGFATQVSQDPTAIANNQASLDAFTKLRNGDNSATEINNVAQNKLNVANNALGTLQQNAANTATETGRFQLLQQALGRSTYNRGQQRLDQLLVQNGGGGVLNNLQQSAQQTAQNANKSLANTNTNLVNGIGDIRSSAVNAKGELTKALGSLDTAGTDADESGGAFGALQKSLQARQKDFINTNQSLADNLNAGVTNDTFNQQALSRLGLNAGQNLYDVNLQDYITPTWASGNVSEQSVADDQDYSRYQALAKLAGTDPSYLMQNQVGTKQGLGLDETKLQSLRDALSSRDAASTSNVATLNDIRNNPYAGGNGRDGLIGATQLFQDHDGNGNVTRNLSQDEVAARVGELVNRYGYVPGGATDPQVAYFKQITDWYKQYANNGLGSKRQVATTPEQAAVVKDNTFNVK